MNGKNWVTERSSLSCKTLNGQYWEKTYLSVGKNKTECRKGQGSNSNIDVKYLMVI